MSPNPHPPAPLLESLARLPAAGDNAAIALRGLKSGERWAGGDATHTLAGDVPLGHRFAIRPIPAGSELLSWGMPFGTALRDIAPGEYLCNEAVLRELALRRLDLAVPTAPNFGDWPLKHAVDLSGLAAGRPLTRHAAPGQFMGYARPGGRGTGTRNYVVILGTSSRTGSLARLLADRLRERAAPGSNLDGIVPIAHTEGADDGPTNNRELLLRTLAGFIVHPNVGAVLALDLGTETVDNRRLEAWLRDNGYPIDHVPHFFHTVTHDIAREIDECGVLVRPLLEAADGVPREARPLSELKVALQCGGSDAFSGISGNPLAAATARELLRHGGSAVLAETDELIGAEAYLLANVRDRKTAEAFLERIDSFQRHAARHGHSAAGNPSGGNLFRGLYNITLKSLGAALKKSPDVRLDHVIDYGARLADAGFHFMDSPGNDLESIAGQVAAGCNLIFFITGNGSITNFPFVPTVKFITTTERWRMLQSDMDINAGRYLDGAPMEELSQEAFRYAIEVASGASSAGERAGHAQVQIWRNWRMPDTAVPEARVTAAALEREPDGKPLPIRAPEAGIAQLLPSRGIPDRVGLLMPSSLCAGQVAGRIVAELNTRLVPNPAGVSRFVALPHTEGCGVSGGESEEHYLRVLTGHLLHPSVACAMLLEHGCEKTHNARLREALKRRGIDPDRFGYASIQLDGGFAAVAQVVQRWFAAQVNAAEPTTGTAPMSLGLMLSGKTTVTVETGLARLCLGIAANGGTAVLPENSALPDSPRFLRELGLDARPPATLGFGQIAETAGIHVMHTPTAHLVETLTGLGATGVGLLLAVTDRAPVQGHPLIPTLQVGLGPLAAPFAADLDFCAEGETDAEAFLRRVSNLLRDCTKGRLLPRAWQAGYIDFQLTRGLTGVSL